MLSVLRASGLLAAYAAFVTWLTWPLAEVAADQLPDVSVRADPLYAAWALAYQTHVLVTAPATLADANIYHPASNALFYGPPGFGALPLFAPVFLATANPALAINLTLLAGVTLSAWGLHLVVRRWTHSFAAGLIAGSALLATPAVIWSSASTPQYAALMYYPSLIYLAATPLRRAWQSFTLLALTVLQSLTDLVYVAPPILLTLGTIAAWRCARPTTRAAGVRLLLVLGAAFLLLAPGYAGYVAVRLDNPDLLQQSVWYGNEGVPGLGAPVDGPTAVPVWSLGLVLVGLVVRLQLGRDVVPATAWKHGLLWAAGGVAMPWLAPYAAALVLGDGEIFRVGWRLGLGSVFGLTILAGLGLVEIGSLLRPRRFPELALALVITLLVYADYRRDVPPVFPTFSPDAPRGADLVLARRDGPVLNLPVGKTGLAPSLHARAMYESIFHWRPLLNGYGSYWPAGFAERMELARRLPDPEALAELRRQTGLAFLVVRRNASRLAIRPWRKLLADPPRTDLQLIHQDDDDLVFELTGPVR